MQTYARTLLPNPFFWLSTPPHLGEVWRTLGPNQSSHICAVCRVGIIKEPYCSAEPFFFRVGIISALVCRVCAVSCCTRIPPPPRRVPHLPHRRALSCWHWMHLPHCSPSRAVPPPQRSRPCGNGYAQVATRSGMLGMSGMRGQHHRCHDRLLHFPCPCLCPCPCCWSYMLPRTSRTRRWTRTKTCLNCNHHPAYVQIVNE